MIFRTVFSLYIFLFTLFESYAQFEQDKVLHFGAGILSGAAGVFVADQLSDGDQAWIYVGAIGGSLLAGSVKEAIDHGKSDNSWDNGDLAVTVLGGVTVGVTLNLFSGKKRKKKNRVSLVIF